MTTPSCVPQWVFHEDKDSKKDEKKGREGGRK